MRHLVKGRKLGRTASHRKATLMALSVALIKNDRIVTTLAKAKALRSYVEPIITRSKEDNTHNRSYAFRHLRDNKATSKLFDEVAPMVTDRPGGYTRIIKIGSRLGDAAEEAMIELVDFNDVPPEIPGKKKRRTRRGRSGAGKKEESKASSSDSKKGNQKSDSKKPEDESKKTSEAAPPKETTTAGKPEIKATKSQAGSSEEPGEQGQSDNNASKEDKEK